MKKFLFLVAVSGCGYSSVGNEMTGQVKRVIRNTPIVCPDYVVADVSMGVMRNGVGSMSTQDVFLTVEDKSNIDFLEDAARTAKPVTITYRVKRVVWCIEDHTVESAKYSE